MKITKTLVYALALCLSLVSVAEAKGRSGSTFKGGFSSQRQKAPKPAPSYQVPTQSTKPSFGSFGGNKAATQPASNYQPSQMSRDMTTANAQSNAQKTWDARNKPQAADSQTATNSKSDNGWFRSGNQGQTAQTPPPNYNQGGRYNDGGHYNQGGQYRNERRGDSGGGFWNGVMWFMLGHSLANSSHANTTVVTVPATTTQAANGSMDLGPGENTQAASAPVNEPQTAEPEPESALVSLLRAVLWTVVIVAGFWMLRGFMRMRNRLNKGRSNYNLGK